VVLKGFVDHSDSHGEAGRYGNGDVQWMTAGSGLQHAEMFPLINKDKPNPLELFQIWINLPKAKKMCTPHFAMLWADKIPVYAEKDKSGHTTEVTVIAGRIKNVVAPDSAPDSWAADPANEVGIWLVKIQPNAAWTMPRASAGINRSVYFYQGSEIAINGAVIPSYHSADLVSDQDATIENSQDPAYILVLQGKPIDEPVVQYGPFVMNSDEEINQAYSDYRKTRFGGWPWPRYDNVHSREKGRFASYKDGRKEFR
jgi:redox-sensitive bicupin YhaK (pirin superfamily)